MQAAARVSPWAMLIEQFRNVFALLLLAATALSTFVGHGVEAIIIAIIVLFAVLLGFVQEYRVCTVKEEIVDTSGSTTLDRALGAPLCAALGRQ